MMKPRKTKIRLNVRNYQQAGRKV